MIDIVEKQGLGLCADPESLDDIATGLERLLFDDAFRNTCAANALRMAEITYCYEVQAAALIETVLRFARERAGK